MGLSATAPHFARSRALACIHKHTEPLLLKHLPEQFSLPEHPHPSPCLCKQLDDMDTIFVMKQILLQTQQRSQKSHPPPYPPPQPLVLGAWIPAIKQHPDTGGTGSEGVVEGGPSVLGCRVLLTKGFCHYPPSFYF